MEQFEELVATLDPPMFVVTARAGDERDGCLVGFATQCSIDPPRFFVCLSEKNRTFAGRVLARHHDLGDHVGFVLAVVDAELVAEGTRLGMQSVLDLDPGHPA